MGRKHPLHTLEVLLLVGVGGFAGSNLRYFVSIIEPGLTGTLIANVAGCFALGFILYEAIYMGYLADQTHFVVGTGFLSSFTTYSTFAVQTTQAISPLWMVGNVVANYGFGLLGVLLGRTLARAINGGSGEMAETETPETPETEVPE